MHRYTRVGNTPTVGPYTYIRSGIVNTNPRHTSLTHCRQYTRIPFPSEESWALTVHTTNDFLAPLPSTCVSWFVASGCACKRELR